MAIFSRRVVKALIANLLLSRPVTADNVTTPTSFFYSRPDLRPPAMTVSVHNSSYLEPGYIFIAPYQEWQAGPYIYDKLGNLVYSGFGDIGPYNAHNVHVCKYNGSSHMCMFQGNQMQGYARGHAVIVDDEYKVVKTIQSVGRVAAADQHEFQVLNDGESALLSIYNQEPYDLSHIGINVQGWVMDSVFQEINLADDSVIFEWRSLDHVEPWGSYVYPKTSDVAGDGLGPQTPWDYFHINSVEKSAFTGNYLISSRHMSTIYNINATDGSILWRLQAGGDSDFTCEDFNFGFQHDARIRSENKTSMVISIYDNASNNYNFTAKASSGKFIELDLVKMTAKLHATPTHYPGEELLSASQGNTQLLGNGNIFHCFGSWPRYTEHTPDGNAVWAAQIGPSQGQVMSYRAYSAAWKSTPRTKPSLFAYSRMSDAMIAVYVSWNGATEVGWWTFWGANDRSGGFEVIGTTAKQGFETLYTSDTHYAYTFAEAVGKDGSSLGNSTVEETFVPSAKLSAACFDTHCPGASR